jgi:FMN phosphatase YigB (HAD superfamily)
MALEAVTFDLWNTLLFEEPGALFEDRVRVWREILGSAGIAVDTAPLRRAHEAALAAYQHAWRAGRQFRSPEATEAALADLGLEVDDGVLPALVESFHRAGELTELHLTPGIERCLSALTDAGLELAVVCDIGLTPSSALRTQLDGLGLLGYFGHLAFSDEVGVYKPDAAIFHAALEGVGGVAPANAAHVGDRRRTDVGGAAALGMTTVRYVGVFDDADDGPEAGAVVRHHDDLPKALGVSG